MHLYFKHTMYSCSYYSLCFYSQQTALLILNTQSTLFYKHTTHMPAVSEWLKLLVCQFSSYSHLTEKGKKRKKWSWVSSLSLSSVCRIVFCFGFLSRRLGLLTHTPHFWPASLPACNFSLFITAHSDLSTLRSHSCDSALLWLLHCSSRLVLLVGHVWPLKTQATAPVLFSGVRAPFFATCSPSWPLLATEDSSHCPSAFL